MARILFIENDELLREAIARLLTHTGYEVVEAQHGRAALNLMRRQPADLVITEIIMPEMDGFETIHFLRRKFPAIKIIAISGDGRIPAGHYLEIARKLGAHKKFGQAVLTLGLVGYRE